ncbi:CsbD family protein [Streptomyces sp. S186]|uniref:CsbD family protein n=1 Tax=Streptomyces sp. S186 TaxID=3434395 RepID=UPI003F66F049
MGIGKKAKSVSRTVTGKTKEATGKATGDKSLELKGKAEKARARARQAMEKGKDAFKHHGA